MSSSPGGLTFVDASGWIALVNRNDGLHQQAARLFKRTCQSPPEHARMNPHGIGERPQRSAEYARLRATLVAPPVLNIHLSSLGKKRF
jgi:predicted nucleic acid-binding protein